MNTNPAMTPIIADLITTAAESAGVSILYLGWAVSVLTWEDGEESACLQLMIRMTDPHYAFTERDRLALHGHLSLLHAVMGLGRLVREGAIPKLSEAEEARLFEIAQVVFRKIKEAHKEV